MGGNGIGIALAEIGVQQLGVLQRENLARGRNAGVGVAEKQLLGLGGGLHSDALTRQVTEGINAAVLAHGDDLTAIHIGLGPEVLVLSAIDGKAAPDTVDGAALHQILLLLPVDGGELGPVTHAAEGLCGKVYINAGGMAAGVLIVKGGIVVAAHGDDGECIRLGRVRARRGCTAAEQTGQQAHGT